MNFDDLNITSEILEEAQRMADELPILNHSIRQGEGTIYGFLGEIIFRTLVGGEQQNTYDYDIVMTSGMRVDVKTKMVNSIPKPHYECSIASGHTHQDCDIYSFVRVMEDKSKGWYVGSILKEDFFQKAHFVKKGDVDKSNNWTAKADCYNLPINELGVRNV
jgi:hypothetical protein